MSTWDVLRIIKEQSRDAAKAAAIALLKDCLAQSTPLCIGVQGDYDGYHVQIGGQVLVDGRMDHYDQGYVIAIGADRMLHAFNVPVLRYELEAPSRPAMTPRDAAKDLVRHTVCAAIAKGRSVDWATHELQELALGHCWVNYWAQIGSGGRGTKHGKLRMTGPGEILVKEVDRATCNEIFSLREIVAELYEELSQNMAQPSLWQEENADGRPAL